MTRKKKILIAIVIALVVCIVGFGVSTTQLYCQTCGSKKTVQQYRFPSWRNIPAIFNSKSTNIETSPFFKDFYNNPEHKHEWKFASENASGMFGYWADGSGFNYNKLIFTYNFQPEFEEYIQQKIKDDKYTKQQIIELTLPKNKAKADAIINAFGDHK